MNLPQLLQNGHYYFPENGHFISEKQRRINEILQDYDPTLELQWIPPDRRSANDVAFRVVHRPPGKPAYVVLTASECDERLLAQVFSSDQQTAAQRLGGNGDLLNYLDNYNAALELVQAKAREEERAEAHEMAAAILRSNKFHYRARVNGKLVDFDSPRNR